MTCRLRCHFYFPASLLPIKDGENAPGSSEPNVVRSNEFLPEISSTGISGEQNSAITCLHTPQGGNTPLTFPPLPPQTASILKLLTPSLTALKTAVRSAQTDGE